MTYILGISAFYHDSAVALIKDGVIVSAAQEERFSRKKHDARYPKNAINYVLQEANIKLNDINHIVFFEKPFLKFERLLETYLAFAPRGFKSFSLSMPIWLREKLFQKKYLFDNLKQQDENLRDISKIKFSEHHYSHAASAFFPSPFKEAVVLTLDGVGEWATTTVAIGKENKIKILKEIHFPHSLGLLYSAFTYYTGFKVNSGEYKLMGLAPYGNPKYKEIILKNGSTVFGKIIYQDDKSLKVETLVGYLIVDRAQVVRIVDNVITEDTQEYVPEQIRESYTPPPMPKLAQPRYTSPNNSAMNASAKFSANCVLVGNISEKKDGQGNIIFDGEIKNIGGRRADFVKVDFVFRKNWSGETKTLTTFVKGSYNTFDTGIVSDASLLPGAVGKFDLYVPQDFGAFIGYSYVIDWEEYQ